MSMEISRAGIQSAQRLQLQSAERIANAGEPGSNVNIVDEALNQSKGENSFKANLLALKTQDEMMGTLLDVMA